LAARTDQRLPRLRIDLARKKYFYLASEVFVLCCARCRLRMNPGAPPKKPRGNDPGIVQDDQLVPAQKLRELRKQVIGQAAVDPREFEHPRTVPAVEGPLGNLVLGHVEIQVIY